MVMIESLFYYAVLITYIHTYQSRFIPKEVADAHVLPKLLSFY
jgi:hypothetical protein